MMHKQSQTCSVCAFIFLCASKLFMGKRRRITNRRGWNLTETKTPRRWNDVGQEAPAHPQNRKSEDS